MTITYFKYTHVRFGQVPMDRAIRCVWDQLKAYSFRNALLVYVTLSFGLTFHAWLLGQAVAPYRQAAESAAPETSRALQIENKGVADCAQSYIAEITGLLNGQRGGWLTLWTEQNELGRPMYGDIPPISIPHGMLPAGYPPKSMMFGGVGFMDPRSVASYQPTKTVDQGDLLESGVQGSQSSVPILSQKFHRD